MRIFFDLDGTLCHTPEGTNYDDVGALVAACTPRLDVLTRVREAYELGHDLGILTARGAHVREATTRQLEAWLGPIAAELSVHHRPRLTFSWKHYVDDKQKLLELEAVDVYVGDRHEDRVAAARAGCRFLWDYELQRHGLAALRRPTVYA